MSEMSSPKISEIMHRLYSVVEELESIYPERPFTLDGHMVGSISECLVADKDFDCRVKLAVNHSGDSDSTGAIAGNILGVLLGRDGLSGRWLANLELKEERKKSGQVCILDLNNLGIGRGHATSKSRQSVW